MSWEPLNLASSEFAVEAEPPTICDLIYAGKRHVISGPPESLKTLLVLIILLLAIRSGLKVALIDFEMGPTGTRRMLDDLGATPDELRAIYYVEPETEPAVADIDAIIDAGVTLAAIDAAAGAYDASGLDDNTRKDAETFARIWTRQLWQAGVATLINDHVTKKADNRGAFAIGSERKVGASDVHLGLEVVVPFGRGRRGLVKIRTHKDRPGFLSRPVAAELELRSDPETGAIGWEFHTVEPSTNGGEFVPTALMESVSRYLEGCDEPASRSAVETNVKGKNVKYVRLAMDLLVRDRYVDETPGPYGARLMSSAKPYRASSSSSSSDLVQARPDEDVTSSSGSSSPSTGRADGTRPSGTNHKPARPDEDEAERLLALGRREGLA